MHVDILYFYSLKGTEYKIILQGIGQEDRTSWLQVMEGREPVSTCTCTCILYLNYRIAGIFVKV